MSDFDDDEADALGRSATMIESPAAIERSGVCAGPAAAVVGEAMVRCPCRRMVEKFGGDSIEGWSETGTAFQSARLRGHFAVVAERQKRRTLNSQLKNFAQAHLIARKGGFSRCAGCQTNCKYRGVYERTAERTNDRASMRDCRASRLWPGMLESAYEACWVDSSIAASQLAQKIIH